MADEQNPCWGYSKDFPEGKLFQDGELPKGFVDSPAKLKKPSGNADKNAKKAA